VIAVRPELRPSAVIHDGAEIGWLGQQAAFVQAVRPTWALLGLGSPTFLSTAIRAW
jgi:hypothetical protein